jgi:ribose 5-phosphate isomerase A
MTATPARLAPVSPDADREKRAAAEAAAELVPDGARVGLGTGSTVAFLLPALARRRLDLRCVATSPASERQAVEAGLFVEPFESLDELDIAIDGADQVDPDGWLVKGGGGAHTREKVVAGAARRFVVIVGADKEVDALRPPIPLELLAFGLPATLRALAAIGEAAPRAGAPRSPDGGVIADLSSEDLSDPAGLAARLDAIPGVIEHGLFAPELVSEVLVARGDRVERWPLAHA